MPGYAGNNNHKKGAGRVRTFKKFSSLLKKSAKKSKKGGAKCPSSYSKNMKGGGAMHGHSHHKGMKGGGSCGSHNKKGGAAHGHNHHKGMKGGGSCGSHNKKGGYIRDRSPQNLIKRVMSRRN